MQIITNFILFQTLADRCPSLEVLHLDCCDRLSMDSLSYAFNRLSELRILRMSEFNVFANTPSPLAVTAMRSMSKLSHLTELYLNNNFLIDDTVICAVARGCPSLETLDISGGNRALTDHSLVSLGRFAFRTLKRLNFSYLTLITDIGVKALAKCTKLRALVLHRCDRIRDNGLIELAKHCSSLRQLDVSYCPWVTNATVSAFCKERKRRHFKLNAEKRKKKKMTGETSATTIGTPAGSNGGIQRLDSTKRGKKDKLSQCGIIMFVDATRVSNIKPKNQFWVKLNFRDVLNYWT